MFFKKVFKGKEVKTEETGGMSKKDFFKLLDMLDWDKQGDDEAVLEPLITYLSQQEDETIFLFDDKMAQLLYALDTKKIAKWAYMDEDYFSADGFLYTRCIALVNGEAFYDAILNGRRRLDSKMEFESILYVAMEAWAKRHAKDVSEYPYITKVSYETGSNKEGWEESK